MRHALLMDLVEKGQAPVFLRTYKAQGDKFARGNSKFQIREPIVQGEHGEISIVQACRATSAAPTYFPHEEIKMNIDEEEVTYAFVDGGIGTNNPTHRAWTDLEAQIRTKGRRHGKCPLIVSIGTGLPKTAWSFKYLPTSLRRGITDTEAVHKSMQDEVTTELKQGSIDKDHYFRFNVAGLENVKLDELTTKHQPTLQYIDTVIEAAFRRTPGTPAPQIIQDMEILAEKLVENRRMRATANSNQGKAYWERFTNCTMYRCPKLAQPVAFDSHKCFERLFSNREELRRHLHTHNDILDKTTDGCVFRPLYTDGPW